MERCTRQPHRAHRKGSRPRQPRAAVEHNDQMPTAPARRPSTSADVRSPDEAFRPRPPASVATSLLRSFTTSRPDNSAVVWARPERCQRLAKIFEGLEPTLSEFAQIAESRRCGAVRAGESSTTTGGRRSRRARLPMVWRSPDRTSVEHAHGASAATARTGSTERPCCVMPCLVRNIPSLLLR
jgi:hypothetical protein